MISIKVSIWHFRNQLAVSDSFGQFWTVLGTVQNRTLTVVWPMKYSSWVSDVWYLIIGTELETGTDKELNQNFQPIWSTTLSHTLCIIIIEKCIYFDIKRINAIYVSSACSNFTLAFP